MNELPVGALFGVLGALILASACFSGSETALMSLNRYRLRHRANAGDRSAQRVAKLLERPDLLISLILLGNNFVNISASAIATVLALRLMGETGIAVATGLLTLVLLLFGEITPKTFATRRAEQVASVAARVYSPLIVVLYPLVLGTNWISSLLLRLLGVRPDEVQNEHLSSDELRTVLNETAGMVPQRHRDMLVNILDLATVSVEEIMVPRNEIVGIDLEDPWEQVLRTLGESPHGLLVVWRENIDQVVGVVRLRRMLDALQRGQITREYLESVTREPYFVPEGTTLTVQLLNFQSEKRRVGLVVDEYGDIQGLITLEDILEEIVGSFDNDPQLGADPEIVPQPDGGWIVDGVTGVRALNRTFGWSLPNDGPKTLNGLMLEYLEAFPDEGASFAFEGHPVTVLEVEENRVKRVRIEPAFSGEGAKQEFEATGTDGAHRPEDPSVSRRRSAREEA